MFFYAGASAFFTFSEEVVKKQSLEGCPHPQKDKIGEKKKAEKTNTADENRHRTVKTAKTRCVKQPLSPVEAPTHSAVLSSKRKQSLQGRAKVNLAADPRRPHIHKRLDFRCAKTVGIAVNRMLQH